MSNLIFYAILICILVLIIGIIKPSIVIRYGGIENRNRKKVVEYYGLTLISLFMLFSLCANPIKNIGDVFFYLQLICIVALILGLIKPSIVIKWGRDEKRNRKSVVIYYGLGLIFSFILFGMTYTPVEGVESNNIGIEIKSEAEAKAKEEKERLEAEAKAKEEEERLEAEIPIEVISGDVWVNNQIDGDDKYHPGYYVLKGVKYSNYLGEYVSDGKTFGVVIADGSMTQPGVQYYQLVNTGKMMGLIQENTGFTFDVPVYRHATDKEINAYYDYINNPMQSYQDAVDNNTYEETYTIDMTYVELFYTEEWDGYTDYVFGYGDTPYVLRDWHDDNLVPDFENGPLVVENTDSTTVMINGQWYPATVCELR